MKKIQSEDSYNQVGAMGLDEAGPANPKGKPRHSCHASRRGSGPVATLRKENLGPLGQRFRRPRVPWLSDARGKEGRKE
jgi:hypothetical protein